MIFDNNYLFKNYIERIDQIIFEKLSFPQIPTTESQRLERTAEMCTTLLKKGFDVDQ